VINKFPEPIDDETPCFKKPVQAGYVNLPFNDNQFKEFIKGLLGSPQTIGRFLEGVFEITVEDIASLHKLILQRVMQQNDGILAQFRAKISFSDNSSVELTSIEELITYNEIRPIISRALELSWDFLVRFQDKDYPEKQQIQVSLIASNGEIPTNNEERFIFIESFHKDRGIIIFRIEHTARTWGFDIASLLSDHLKSLLKPIPKYKKFIKRNRGRISFTFAAFFFAVSIVGSLLTLQKFAAHQILSVKELIKQLPMVNVQAINTKIDFLNNFIANGVWSQFYLNEVIFILICIFIAIWLGIWIEGSLDHEEPSFLLLTKKSIEYREIRLRMRKHNWISFGISITVSVFSGLLANLIFSYLSIKG